MDKTKVNATPLPSLEERLKVYGLTPNQVQLENLALGEGECIHLTLRGDSRFAKAAQRIPVKTVGDLKRLIGVPDSVVQQHCSCRFGAELAESVPAGFKSPNDLTPTQLETLRLAAKEFIYGNSQSVSHYEPALNLAISLVARSIISILLFQDIIVERNATLTLDASIDVIFANKILIKLGGKIRALGSFVKYDCSSAQGEELPFIHLGGVLTA
jgi:hypothetical protein